MLANAIDEPSVFLQKCGGTQVFFSLSLSPFSFLPEASRGERTKRREGEEKKRGGVKKEKNTHQWTVMESREEGEDASTADALRPPVHGLGTLN